jgi:hypothetical protein
MPKFNVTICRVSYAHKEVTIEANNASEAWEIADAQAGNHEYAEKRADYHIERIEQTSGLKHHNKPSTSMPKPPRQAE